MSDQQFDIFMSHKKQDKAVVKQIAARLLDEYSVRSWIDEWDLSAGEDWEQAIEQTLSGCTACAVFLGGNGWGDYHLKEAKFALGLMQQSPEKFRMIPVLLPGAAERDMKGLGDFFQKRHRVDFSNGVNDEGAFQALRAAIRGEAQGPPSMSAFTIRRDAHRWKQAPGNDKSSLYRGYELREAQTIAVQFAEHLNETAVQFLAASATEEQRVINSERRRNRIIIAVLSLLLMAFAASTVYAFRKRSEAERQTVVANEQTKVAQEQREEALKQSRIAERQSQLAEERRQAEQKQRNIAEDQTKVAEQRRNEADQEKQNAQKQTQIAEQQRRVADEQRQQAVAATARANEEAERYRRQSYVGSMSQAEQAWRLKDNNWLLELLESQEPESGQEDLRGFEWYYRRRLAHQRQNKQLGGVTSEQQEALTFAVPPDGTHLAVFSPDGKRLFTKGSQNSEVRLWDTDNGREVASLGKEIGQIIDLGLVPFSPDGKFVVTTAGKGTVKLSNATTGTEIKTLKSDQSWITAYAFSPDGAMLATGSSDHTVKIWNIAAEQEVITLKLTHVIGSVAFTADATRVVAGDYSGYVKIWEISSGKEILAKRVYGEAVAVMFTPDGKRVTAGSMHGAIDLWEVDTGKSLLDPEVVKPGSPSLRNLEASYGRVAFSTDGLLMATGGKATTRDGQIKRTVDLWSTVTGKRVQSLKGHAGSISHVVFSPDGKRLVSAGSDSIVKLWDIRTGREVLSLEGHTKGISAVGFSPDGSKIATSSYDKTVKIWIADKLKEIAPSQKPFTQKLLR